MENEITHTEKQKFTSFLKWALIIFFVLLVLTVSLGITPLGVRELNNYFFSLFINDERTEANAPQAVAPTVTLSLDSMISSKKTETEKPTLVQAPSAPVVVKSPTVSSPTAVSANSNNPVRIVNEKVGLDTTVLNPLSTNLNALNDQLLYGAVRYAESGDLESTKNILVFGHSSELPVVHNQNFKIFNGLKRLSAGDEITVYSKSKVYRYMVTSVKLTRAEDEVVTFSDDHELILATCNVLGAKEERYVVRASFVGSYSVAG